MQGRELLQWGKGEHLAGGGLSQVPGQLVPPDSAGNDGSDQWTTVGLNGCARLLLLALGRAVCVCVPLLSRHFLFVLSFTTVCTVAHPFPDVETLCVGRAGHLQVVSHRMF